MKYLNTINGETLFEGHIDKNITQKILKYRTGVKSETYIKFVKCSHMGTLLFTNLNG